jgi:hypothetical protein
MFDGTYNVGRNCVPNLQGVRKVTKHFCAIDKFTVNGNINLMIMAGKYSSTLCNVMLEKDGEGQLDRSCEK